MNWQHLTYFRTTAEMQNLTKAAEELYITPSALSKAIHSLEEELGFPLFERSGRNITLTKFGKTYYSYVVEASNNLSEGLHAVQKEMGLRTGTIHLGGIYTMVAEYLPPRLKIFKDHNPDVTFSYHYMLTADILHALRSGTLDLGFCGDFDLESEDYSDIGAELIRVEGLMLIVPNNHRFVTEELTDLSQLADEQFILYKNVNSGITPRFWKLMAQASFVPQIAISVSDDHSIFGLVASGLGIAVVPDNESLKNNPNVTFLQFPKPRPTRNQYMVWSKTRFMSPAVLAFKDLIHKHIDPTEIPKGAKRQAV